MRFVHVKLGNWRNFKNANIDIDKRTFLVGPNASGKSNFLDVFRFLRDVADPQGGFQRAVQDQHRGGVSQIRSLYARQHSNVLIQVAVESASGTRWQYHLEFNQDNQRRPIVRKEKVVKDGKEILVRPDETDQGDQNRLTQTHLEQVSANKEFRELAQFFADVRYLHIVPQLIREPERSVGKQRDPYGGDFLEQLARALQGNGRVFRSRIKKIEAALKVAVPKLKELRLERDVRGTPHLKGLYEHWRPNAGWQTEEQLSDGTLRLLGLLWSVLDGTSPLLLEEPELSLHAAVVRCIPQMLARLIRKSGRQIIISTHSAEMLSDEGISAKEVLLIRPSDDGSQVVVAATQMEIQALLQGGLSIADAVIPQTAPENARQLTFFGD